MIMFEIREPPGKHFLTGDASRQRADFDATRKAKFKTPS